MNKKIKRMWMCLSITLNFSNVYHIQIFYVFLLLFIRMEGSCGRDRRFQDN